MRSSFLPVLLMIAVTIAGCATPPSSPDPDIRSVSDEAFRFKARSKLPAGSSNRFQTALSAELGTPFLDYKSEYSVISGSLVQSLADSAAGPSGMPMDVARQTVHQAVRMDLPTQFDAPIQMGLDWKHDRRLRLDGEKRSESARAHFRWKPAPLLLEVEWTQPRRHVISSDPFDCVADGHLLMPLPLAPEAVDLTMDISRRDCLVQAPARGVDDLTMQAEGLAWIWGEERESLFRLQRIAMGSSDPFGGEGSSGLELGLTRNQSWHGWNLQADLAWRRADVPGAFGQTGEKDWSVDLMLRRNIELVVLTARWMRKRDPLWFVPTAAPIGTNRVSMLLDFTRWLTEHLPALKPSMSASWERRQTSNGADDDRIRWDFSIHW